MKKFRLRTHKKPVTVIIPLESEGPIELFITGYDPASPRTEYFSRKIEINGSDEVQFNCPQSPNILKVVIWSAGSGQFSAPGINFVDLGNINNFIDQDSYADVRFIEKFARVAGRFPARRTYRHKKAHFRIEYLPVIRKDDGSPHPTPARIHTTYPIIQVSKRHFDEMTVPARIAILLHEYSHNFLNYNQDSEFEADENAMAMYSQLSYPRLEAVYAFTNVMPDTDTNVQRVENIMSEL